MKVERENAAAKQRYAQREENEGKRALGSG
jgi:hypothetical protein